MPANIEKTFATNGNSLYWWRGYSIKEVSSSPDLPNYVLIEAYRIAICAAWDKLVWQAIVIRILPEDKAPSYKPNLWALLGISVSKVPSGATWENLLSKLSLGILKLLKIMNPLSTPSKPNFFPQSPKVIPVKGIWLVLSLIGTTKAWGP